MFLPMSLEFHLSFRSTEYNTLSLGGGIDTTCFAFVSHANDGDKQNLQAMPCVGYTKISNYMDEEGRKACGEHDTHSSVPQVFQEDIKIDTNKHRKDTSCFPRFLAVSVQNLGKAESSSTADRDNQSFDLALSFLKKNIPTTQMDSLLFQSLELEGTYIKLNVKKLDS